ncbi:MAG: thiamine diphosphokinase [Candidatus Berkiella sp.]
MYDAIIVVNGELPQPPTWQDLPYRTLICTDGAANYFSQLTITPDIIIGDMDSISVGTQFTMAKSLQTQFPNSKIVVNSDQHTTDFEKCLIFAQQNAIKRILCIGALGKAADHAIYNLSLIARYQTTLEITLLNIYDTHRQWVFPLHNQTQIEAPIDSQVSLFPLSEVLITTSGLKWELNQETISPLSKGAIRNISVKSETSIEVDGPCLCFVICDIPPNVQFSS